MITAFSISSCLIVGCTAPSSTPAPVVNSTSSTADWKNGEYTVSFRAGPGSYEKSFSSYDISRKFEKDDYPKSIAVESALLLTSFLGNSKPGDLIKLFTSSTGKTLLIEEDIPNDCAPCRNWILVRGMEGDLIYDYLNVPSRPVPPEEIMGEFPQIIKVTENEVTFRYSDGKKDSVMVKDVTKKEKRPTFPG